MRLCSRSLIRDAGGVLGSWFVLLTLENLCVALLRWPRARVVSDWGHAQLYVTPIAISIAVPLAIGLVLLGHAAAKRQAAFVAAVVAAFVGYVAWGSTNGRHLASLFVRVPVVAIAVAAAFFVARPLVRRAPLDRPQLLAAGGLTIAVSAWLADAFLLKLLYPAIHAGLFTLTIVGAALASLPFRRFVLPKTSSAATLSLVGVTTMWSPFAMKALGADESLRYLLFNNAPVLGRTTAMAMRLSPPSAFDPNHRDPQVTALTTATEGPRALDWSGCDVLLLTVDALRADHLGAYGYGRHTSPQIDRLAARGARFEYAYSPVPNTSYSLTSLLTGRAMRPRLVEGQGELTETLADTLGNSGYRTAAFYPPAVFYVDAPNFKTVQTRAFGFQHHIEAYARPKERTDQLEAYLDQVSWDQPVFVWMHVYEPHEPYEMHPEFPISGTRPVDAYDSEIAAADAIIGRAVALIESRHRQTVIIVTADHGEAFGEHGMSYHGTNVYEEQVRVPLIVVGPGVSQSVISSPAQTIDVAPTLLSALGRPRPVHAHGRDLGELIAAGVDSPDKGFAFSESVHQTLVAQGTERLVCDRAVDSCELYDLARDPRQESPIQDRAPRAHFLKNVTAAVQYDNRNY